MCSEGICVQGEQNSKLLFTDVMSPAEKWHCPFSEEEEEEEEEQEEQQQL